MVPTCCRPEQHCGFTTNSWKAVPYFICNLTGVFCSCEGFLATTRAEASRVDRLLYDFAVEALTEDAEVEMRTEVFQISLTSFPFVYRFSTFRGCCSSNILASYTNTPLVFQKYCIFSMPRPPPKSGAYDSTSHLNPVADRLAVPRPLRKMHRLMTRNRKRGRKGSETVARETEETQNQALNNIKKPISH